MTYTIVPIGFVDGGRSNPDDDFWGGENSRILLYEHIDVEALSGLDTFSHVEVVFLFHKVNEISVVTGARHPRENFAWPKVGIFAQRGKNRPNRIGTTICKVVRVEGRTLIVSELDALIGTPIIDIKPVMREFLPRQTLVQPQWSRELMSNYWLTSENGARDA